MRVAKATEVIRGVSGWLAARGKLQKDKNTTKVTPNTPRCYALVLRAVYTGQLEWAYRIIR